jgi:hypothetical protein
MRPRVSILNLLLVTTIVALVIVVVRLYHELDHERSLRLQLLQNGGILQVTDLDVVHVVKVDTDESDGSLSWRVYVPKGRSVILNVRLNTMPDDKIVPRLPPNAIVVADRSPSNPIDLGPGEHVVSLSWAQGKARFTLDVVGTGSRHTRPFSLPGGRSWEWNLAYQMDVTHIEHTPITNRALQNGETLTLQVGKTFVLDRHRFEIWPRYPDASAKRGNKRTEHQVGELLVWLQPDD